jgi:tetratricopeptide (TPR) repeat protein
VHALDRVGSYVRSHPTDPEGYIITIRLSDKLARREIFKEGLQRLSRLPGQTGVAVALRSELLLAKKGSKQVVDGIEKSKIDLAAEANAPALKLLVEKLAELERHDEALERVAAALAKHPDSSVFHAVHGSVLQAASAPPSQVRDAYTKAIELAPENADALMSLAEFEATSGDASTALTLYERADATDPATADAASAALGLARGSLSKPELEQRLVELLRRYPHDASFASELAVLLTAKGGEMQRALELARRAGIFGRHPYEEARTALRAIEASGAQPQADVARAAIERLAEAPSSTPKTNTKTTPGTEPNSKSTTKTNTKTRPGE